MNQNSKTTKYPELSAALKDVKSYFILAGVFSAAINVLMLVPVIYMLQVYDRVMSSGSLSTLTMLTLLMVALLMAMGGFEWVRSRILISASNRLEKNLRKRVSQAAFKNALLSGGRGGRRPTLVRSLQLEAVFNRQRTLRVFRCALVSYLCRRNVYVSHLVRRRRHHLWNHNGCPGLYQ